MHCLPFCHVTMKIFCFLSHIHLHMYICTKRYIRLHQICKLLMFEVVSNHWLLNWLTITLILELFIKDLLIYIIGIKSTFPKINQSKEKSLPSTTKYKPKTISAEGQFAEMTKTSPIPTSGKSTIRWYAALILMWCLFYIC